MRYVLAMLVLYAAPLAAQQQPSPWGLVARALGKTGAPPGETYRATFPRSDLRVRVGDVAIAPALALTSWAAFAGSADSADVMGDLVLTERRAPPPLPSRAPASPCPRSTATSLARRRRRTSFTVGGMRSRSRSRGVLEQPSTAHGSAALALQS